MKKIIVSSFLILNTLFATAWAANLIEVYRQALACDPTFKAAQAQYLATRENMSIARAALLPNVLLSGLTQRQVINASTQARTPNIIGLNGTFYNTQNQYMLNLTQPIFNYSAWAQLSTAEYQVKQAEATFAAAAQDLMIRTAQAYFGVLQANDILRYTQAQKKAVAEQLRQTRQQYEVGLVAITGVKEAEANYDSLVASEIAAKNSLANAVEQLRAITTKAYPGLMGVNNNLPLLQPDPADIEQWVSVSERQNYSLQAAINAAMSAEQNIKAQFGGHLPVINGTAGYSYNHNTQGGVNAAGFIGPSEVQSGQIGLALNFPVYQGGLVNAQTEQAGYQYQNAVSQMEYTHRTVVQTTRNAYLGVITGIGKVAADREAVIAARVALKATLDGYEAGTRNMVDVLIAQSNLYQAQKNYSVDRYNYLINILSLKQSAGTLSPSDLGRVNSWLLQRYNILGKIADIGSYATEIPVDKISDSEKQAVKEKFKAIKNQETKKSKKSSSSKTDQAVLKKAVVNSKKSKKTTSSLQKKVTSPVKVAAATASVNDKKITTKPSNEVVMSQTQRTIIPLKAPESTVGQVSTAVIAKTATAVPNHNAASSRAQQTIIPLKAPESVPVRENSIATANPEIVKSANKSTAMAVQQTVVPAKAPENKSAQGNIIAAAKATAKSDNSAPTTQQVQQTSIPLKAQENVTTRETVVATAKTIKSQREPSVTSVKVIEAKVVESTKTQTAVTEKYYTIALFDTRYESHAREFIRRNGLSEKAHYLTTRNAKGEMRYQVIYGHFKTIKEAEKAMKTLPENLQKLNLWVKLM